MSPRLPARRLVEVSLLGLALVAVASKGWKAHASHLAEDALWVDSTFAGLVVPPVPLWTEDGELDQSFDDGTMRVVFLYSRECSACRSVKPVWERLARVLPRNAKIVAFNVSPGDTSRFLDQPRIRTPRVASLARLRRSFPWRGVPTTAVVSGDGRIVLWVEGMFSERASEHIVREVAART